MVLTGAALLAGLSAALGVSPVRSPNPTAGAGADPVRRARLERSPQEGPGPPGATPVGTSAPRVVGVSVLAGAAVWFVVGGYAGALGGLLVGGVLSRGLARLEPAAARRQRLELVRAAPLVADLMAAALIAGVPLGQAIPVVARAVGGVSGAWLFAVHRRTELGESTERAWSGLAGVPGLGGIARAVVRSSRTGAPLAGVLTQAGDELRAEAGSAALELVRATAVRAVLPLGLCLLPAFALLGIAPIVGGLLPSL